MNTNEANACEAISVSLTHDLVARLDAAARAEDRSRSSFVRRALTVALAEHDKPPPAVSPQSQEAPSRMGPRA